MSSVHTTLTNTTTTAGGTRGAVTKLRGALAQALAHLVYVRSAARPDKDVDMKVSFILNPGLIMEMVPDPDTSRITYVAYNAGGTDVANGAFGVRGLPARPRVHTHTTSFSSRATPSRKKLITAVVRAVLKKRR
jgi:hypothetical protein